MSYKPRFRNIEISPQHDMQMYKAESMMKYWVIAFIAVAWFTRSEVIPESQPLIHVQYQQPHHHKANEVNILRSVGLTEYEGE